MTLFTRSLPRSIIALSIALCTAAPAQADLPAPVLKSVAPAMDAAEAGPIKELRFDYETPVHLYKVQMVSFIGERRENQMLFIANGAYLLGKNFVFPLQQPLTRPGTYRIEVMAQPIDNGTSMSNDYEFTIKDLDVAPENPAGAE